MDVSIHYAEAPVEPVTDFAGAGIVLYMARTGATGAVEAALLVAQEDFVDGWNQSGCWAGVEGRREDGENDIQTAAREFYEDSLHSIPIGGKTVKQRDIEEMLAKGELVKHRGKG